MLTDHRYHHDDDDDAAAGDGENRHRFQMKLRMAHGVPGTLSRSMYAMAVVDDCASCDRLYPRPQHSSNCNRLSLT